MQIILPREIECRDGLGQHRLPSANKEQSRYQRANLSFWFVRSTTRELRNIQGPWRVRRPLDRHRYVTCTMTNLSIKLSAVKPAARAAHDELLLQRNEQTCTSICPGVTHVMRGCSETSLYCHARTDREGSRRRSGCRRA